MPLIQLLIEHDTDTGQISVSGPIDNELYSYGLLEKARQAIALTKAKEASKLVVPAHLVPRSS